MTGTQLKLEDLQRWVCEDPIRQALLVKLAPVGHSTLLQILGGKRRIEPRMAKCLRDVMDGYPNGIPIPPPRAAVG